ncbi:MAG: O-antigen ligase family protein [Patescibacteria group bacterium]
MLKKVYVGLLLVIFAGIVLHAPLSVGFSTLWLDYGLLIKSWKEILLGLAVLLLPVILTVNKRWGILKEPLFLLIAGFAALNIALIPLFFTGLDATLAGILINLRYLLFFVLVYVALTIYPQYIRLFIKVFIAGALVVLVFAILQVTVLPHDILKYIGYGETTIMPYLTVDQNINFIRINSTLRGPNPLGAYAMIVLVLLLAYWLRGNHQRVRRPMAIVAILGAGSVIALWASYSRSAVLGVVIAVGILLFVLFGRKLSKTIWVALAVTALVIGGSLVAFRDTDFVSNVILHENPSEGNEINSNDGHAESLVDGTLRLVRQPLGGGIGSTGSASLLTDSPVIIENQYLFIAHETGWLGLGLFVAILWLLFTKLWRGRKDWFVLGVFASGIGLVVIGLIQPVWVDETVALIWWGLAAIALARSRSNDILKADDKPKKKK